MATARAALKILSEHPERVKQLEDISNFMRDLLISKGIKIIKSTTPIIPIYVYEDEKAFMACKMLLERGVYVNPVISPATPKGFALLRTSYTATHKKEDLIYAAEQIKQVLDLLDVK